MQAKKLIPGFNEAHFLSQSAEDLRTLYAAISSGNPADLRRLAEEKMTETAFKLVVDGIAESRAAAGGAIQGAEVIEFLKEPRTGRARLIMPKMGGQIPMTQRPTHIQITATYELLVRPFAIVPAAAPRSPAKQSPASGAGGRGKSGRVASLSRDDDSVGSSSGGSTSDGSLAAELKAHAFEEWMPVQETGKGGMTFWVRGAGHIGYDHADVTAAAAAYGMDAPAPPAWHTTWTPPAPGQVLPRRPFRIEMAGVSREPRDGPDGAPVVAVVQQIVWERPIPPAAGPAAAAANAVPPRWRMAKLA